MTAAFTCGVNYWPRRSAMRMWSNFNLDEITTDFKIIRSLLGAGAIVRIFLTPEFVPHRPDTVDTVCVSRLMQVVQLVEALDLVLDISSLGFLHMSGPQFVSPWCLLSKGEDAAGTSAAAGSNPYGLQIVVPRSCCRGSASDADPPPSFAFDENSPACVKITTNYLVFDPNKVTYRSPFHDPRMLQSQVTLLKAVVANLLLLSSAPAASATSAVQAATGIEGRVFFNLCNEQDQFAVPRTPEEGIAWVQLLSRVVREQGGGRFRVTAGLHTDSIRFASTNLPVGGIFEHCSFPVMHAYPQYQNKNVCSNPLDTDFVPFSCVMTSLLVARQKVIAAGGDVADVDAVCAAVRPTLMEEFGGCTAPQGAPSQTWRWKTKALGGKETERQQFLASEEDMAAFLGETLEKLHTQAGACGAILWNFSDYDPSETWAEPPCFENIHERYFGLQRPDGSLKPHAEIFGSFAAKKPVVLPPNKEMLLGMARAMNNTEGVSAPAAGENGTTSDWVRLHADPGTLNAEVALAKLFKCYKELV